MQNILKKTLSVFAVLISGELEVSEVFGRLVLSTVLLQVFKLKIRPSQIYFRGRIVLQTARTNISILSEMFG